MKAILYIVAILVIGGAAFFSLNHSKKFEELQKLRLETIRTHKKTATDAYVKEKELKTAEDDLTASKAKREEFKQSISALKSTATTLEGSVSDANETLKTQDGEFKELDRTMEEVKKIVEGLGGDITIDNLPEKIQQIQDQKIAGEKSLEEKTTLVAAAEKKLASDRSELDRQIKRDMERNSRINRNSMESVITAVNQDWGFLVIGAGSNSGFTPQTNLIVQRDGRMIGRVRPSSIEPTQTIAEIDFNSVAPGVRMQPGDRVILTKPSN